MRPVPIPDELIGEGCKRFVVGAPDGDLASQDIGPVEVVARIVEGGALDGTVCQSILLVLDDGELERLTSMTAPAVWLHLYTRQLPVFAVELADGLG